MYFECIREEFDLVSGGLGGGRVGVIFELRFLGEVVFEFKFNW